jgi:hypothetical protein
MRAIILGLLFAGVAFAGYRFWKVRWGPPPAPVVRVVSEVPATGKDRRRKKRVRGATRLARAGSHVAAGGVAAASEVGAAMPGATAPTPDPPWTTDPAPKVAAVQDPGSASRFEGRRDPVPAPSIAAGTRPAAPAPDLDPEPEPIKLSAADLRMLAQGDNLSSRPEVLRFDMSNDNQVGELSQDAIDERFRADESAILGCIAKSRPDPETYVPGSVTIAFRILRAGTVRGVRIEAPAILQKGGLLGCVKGVLGRMRFPAGATNQVVSYPFSLN